MANGISIHIGLNTVDPNQYDGWDGALVACEFDAKDMQALVKGRGFKTTMLLTKDATVKNVTDALAQAAAALKSGDTLFLTYSGHGGQVPDKNGDETDAQDETWVLYDRQLVDDELYGLWGKFKKGVRILMLSDSCHSGSVTKGDLISNAIEANAGAKAGIGADGNAGIGDLGIPRFRVIPDDVMKRVYKSHRKEYDQIQADNKSGDKVKIGASVILISGCQDNQLSSDGDKNGLFTGTLLKVWNKGRYRSSLAQFHRRIRLQMPPWQSPNYYKVGPDNTAFEQQRPFTI